MTHSFPSLTATSAALSLAMLLSWGCNKTDATEKPTAACCPDHGPGHVHRLDAPPAATAKNPATVLVTVDGAEITQSEADEEIGRMMAQFGGQIPPEQMKMFADQMLPRALESIITRKLLQKASMDANIEVADERVIEQMEEIAQSLPEGMSIEDAMRMHGMDLDTVREQIRDGLRIQQLVESRSDTGGEPDAAAVQGFYDDNPQFFERSATTTARHILFSFQDDPDEAAREALRQKAETLRQSLIEGADFEALAREHSGCPSGQEGGSLPPFGAGQMVPEFEAAAFALEPGALSDVVETQFGYHIIRLEDRADAGKTPFEEVSDDIKDHLRNQNRNQAFGTLVEELRQAADIRYTDPSMKPSATPDFPVEP